jgi:hypothetical protein
VIAIYSLLTGCLLCVHASIITGFTNPVNL